MPYDAIKCPMPLIEALKQYRLEKKLTQEQLAKKLGVSFSTINRWFNGRVKPNQIQSYQIVKLLKMGNQKS